MSAGTIHNTHESIRFQKVRSIFLWAILSALLVTTLLLSALIPPFQSPDEFEHLKRAYLLTTANIVLHPEGVESSGGNVNTGLLEYMEKYTPFPFNPSRKVTSQDIEQANLIRWSDVSKFSPVYSVGGYFPGIYFPQAVGLYIGKKFNMTIANSYQLAKLLAILGSVGLILWGFLLYSPPPISLALIFLPMSLYQFSSTSIDGIASAIFIFVLSIFFNLLLKKEHSSAWLAIPLGIGVFLLSSSRPHALPLLLLIFYAFRITKNTKFLYSGLLTTLLSAVWLYKSIGTTVDRRVANTVLPSEIFSHYLHNISDFFKVLYSTLGNIEYTTFYYRSLIGNLGWANWPQSQFSLYSYYFFGAAILSIALLSISSVEIKKHIWTRTLLILCSFGSVLIVFFALLVTWNTHPAKIIDGVQGRYFLFPMLFIAYAIGGSTQELRPIKTILSSSILIIFIAYSIIATTQLLLARYYISI
jgi:uncharacterized membrane protein